MVARLQSFLLAVAVAAALATPPASGATYTVGEPGGSWDLQTNLTSWASSIGFLAGDELVFRYDAAAHDVVEVDRDGYLSCSAASPVTAALRTGRDVVQLGGVSLTRYFICGVPGHCAAGMRLEVRAACSGGTTALPPPAAPGAGAPGGITICSGGPPTVITTPAVVSHGSGDSGAAPGFSATLGSVLITTMASLLLAGFIIIV
ncbi:unnamed protein product [Urochloa humidicola]